MKPQLKARLKRFLACRAITQQLGLKDQSEVMDLALSEFLQRHLPSAEKGAAVNLLQPDYFCPSNSDQLIGLT